MTVWQAIWGFWLWLLTRLRLRTQTFRTLRVTDIPAALQTEKIYVAGEDGYDWSAAMLCPGGCGKVLEMNLLPGRASLLEDRRDAGRSGNSSPVRVAEDRLWLPFHPARRQSAMGLTQAIRLSRSTSPKGRG